MQDINKNKIFYLACLGFSLGVLWRSFFHVNFYVVVFLILFFSLIARKNWEIIILVVLLAFSIGVLRFHLADGPAPEVFEKQINQKISLSGIIIDEPVKSENNIKLLVETKDNAGKTKILLSTKIDKNYQYGDEIIFTGKLEKPKNFITNQIKEFDYINYLRKDDIFYIMPYPKIDILSRDHGNFIKSALFSIKEKFDAAINSAIPAPENILMGGLNLGERSSFSPSLRQSFINTGTIHIVTISGYNVTLVAEWIMKILGFLPISFAMGAGIIAIFLYIILTGGTQTAIRAGIMATLALLAKTTGRMYDISRALALTAVIMIFINPFILAFDVSFELSFLATLAVIFLSPKIEKYFSWIKWRWLRDIVSVTSAAYVFVLPFILYKMGNLSLVALPANIAILPFVPATMILGFITGFAGLISNVIAIIPGKIVYILLHYELTAISFFSHLPFASLSIPNFPFFLVVLIYAIFFYYLFKKTELSLIMALFLTLLTAGLLAWGHYESNQIAKQNMQTLLTKVPAAQSFRLFEADARIKSKDCKAKNNLPDHECTPGAIFENATVDQICVPGYTKTVRNVSTKLRKEVYAEYGVTYPQPRGAYEVDHLIPLAIGGSNDIANLFLEPAKPAPGFHEKDIVEIYLQQEICAHRVALSVAQQQIANDWVKIYNNLIPEQILTIKKKYGIH